MLVINNYCSAGLLESLEDAIADHRHGNVVPPFEAHQRIKHMYTWPNVARRTEKVYEIIQNQPDRDLHQRIRRCEISDTFVKTILAHTQILNKNDKDWKGL